VAFLSLRVYHFRNLTDTTIPVDAREVFLVGENGQGKTNVLEAIYYMCYASSFRTRRDEQLVRTGQADCAVEGRFTREGDEHEVVVKLEGRRKEISLDGKSVQDRKEIISNVPCVVFCHDDIAFVTGAPEMQRWFMNQTLSLVESAYVDRIRRYNRVLKSRNAALKAGQTELLDVLDAQLVEAGEPVAAERSRMTGQFSEVLEALFAEVFQGSRSLSMTYRPSWKDDPPTHLRERRERDITLATTTSGPHRDRFVYLLGETELTSIASTGQLRLVSLVLRVAQARFVAKATGLRPVLLLDDVLLELDPRRRARFMEALPEYEQAFFTFLPDEQYARFMRESTRTYRVEEGELLPEE
jgi:DNA replication and repair protein RecF